MVSTGTLQGRIVHIAELGPGQDDQSPASGSRPELVGEAGDLLYLPRGTVHKAGINLEVREGMQNSPTNKHGPRTSSQQRAELLTSQHVLLSQGIAVEGRPSHHLTISTYQRPADA